MLVRKLNTNISRMEKKILYIFKSLNNACDDVLNNELQTIKGTKEHYILTQTSINMYCE